MTSADAAALARMLTIGRLVMAPIVAGLLFFAAAVPDMAAAARFWALALFALAAATDAADGYIARRFGAVSALGAGLDHAADKALTAAALVALAATVWPMELAIAAMALIVRDVAIAGLREGLAGSGADLPVDRWGKLKTILLMLGIGAAILEAALISFPRSGIADAAWFVAMIGVWGALGLSLWSAGRYFLQAMRVGARRDQPRGH